jgi:hypothetical protein
VLELVVSQEVVNQLSPLLGNLRTLRYQVKTADINQILSVSNPHCPFFNRLFDASLFQVVKDTDIFDGA